MALRRAKENTTWPENDFILKFQPFIIMCDTLDHQKSFLIFENFDLFVHPLFRHFENSNLSSTTLVDLIKRPHKGWIDKKNGRV